MKALIPPQPNERCDKCDTPVSEWETTPCVQSLTQSPRHTITRYYLTPDADLPEPGIYVVAK